MFFIKAEKLQESDDGSFSRLFPVVQACLTRVGENPESVDEAHNWFPCVIDTGCSHFFALNNSHLQTLVQRDISEFNPCGTISVVTAGHPVNAELRSGNLWLKSNVNGRLKRIELDRGFIFVQTGCPVPLIGVSLLEKADFRLLIDFSEKVFSLCEPVNHFGTWLRKEGLATDDEVTQALCLQTKLRIQLDEVSVLQNPEKICSILRTPCYTHHLGRHVSEIGAELGMISPNDMSYLIPNGSHPDTRIGKMFVALGKFSETKLVELIERFESERRSDGVPHA